MKKDWKKDQEYVALVEDLLATDEVQSLAEFTQHHYSTRLDHSIAVSYRSYLLAKRLGGDVRSTARAGLLHDLFYYDWRTEEYTGGTHAYVHPRVALENAEKLTELNKRERDIIVKHMWLATIAPPRYKESYIVTMVDKYCAINEVIVPACRNAKQRMTSLFNLAS
ncbi:HD domain-containing protein [Vagococcus coleopterorum]|uniref:HD domain-containing protein n=1 Tax=Vagococcus coleopterorum TaxID=2714946 RepID=A0A6G8AN70_9ENTE|nr:HD domain-containing protein [Vagococcus coleopterorum]QIL46446.1 HD domain-containing protein [Vagococcus coleopterorum]